MRIQEEGGDLFVSTWLDLWARCLTILYALRSTHVKPIDSHRPARARRSSSSVTFLESMFATRNLPTSGRCRRRLLSNALPISTPLTYRTSPQRATCLLCRGLRIAILIVLSPRVILRHAQSRLTTGVIGLPAVLHPRTPSTLTSNTCKSLHMRSFDAYLSRFELLHKREGKQG